MTTTKASEEAADKAFWVKCPDCGHCWPVAYFPMEAKKFARIAMQGGKACPKGCKAKPVVAKQKNGELQEPAA